MPGPAIFLSYRRADTGGYAGRLAASLEQRFGPGSVFHDVVTIAPGKDFVQAIEGAIEHAQVVLVVIGDTWLDARHADGGPLLERPDDFVRIEAATALALSKPVLPLLVEGAKMPDEKRLPDNLKALARQQALELSDSRWDYDFERLVDSLRTLTALTGPTDAAAPPRRRTTLLALAAGAALTVAAAVYFLQPARPPDITGRWDLPTGSFWIIVQQGDRFTIEETHYQSREIWKRGTGTIASGRFDFTLALVFERRAPETGSLRLSTDARTLAGELRRSDGRSTPIALTRH
ncbi:MAG: toll/interleukin-1 receptor domain-containing protein [Proteobacteria bacterium]|nr:toll/interleukin-1 receptor domain-containing protein [Burkholderiales bacterium]